VPRAPKSLFDALSDSPATASLLARLAASERAARILAAAVSVPGWNPLHPGHCELRDRTLLLRAASSALAAKLRQSFPSMLGALQRQGVEVIEIRVRVQPERMGYPESGSTQHVVAPMDKNGAAAPRNTPSKLAAQDFADKLALTLTDSPLRVAATKLSRSLRNGSKRD
jgi:hypothetical protein